jgi:predicted  nucleic acid-binding Zn-ribbon protein
LEARLASLEPRLLDLDRQRQVAADALARARASLEAEERKRRELETRVSSHRQLHERNVAQLEALRRARDASAAVSQVEQARRLLADEEGELTTLSRRIAELRQAADAQERAVADIDREQGEARQSVEAERQALDAELREARGKRDAAATKIARPLLAKYDRIRGRRRDDAVFPLHGPSCGNCDTAVPMQRRNLMVTGGAIEVCEVCGVLLYAGAAE